MALQPLWNLPAFFSFFMYTQEGTLDGELALRKAAAYTHTTQIQNKRTQTSMPGVGFEPMIPVI
jgi:hypothetical protein